MQIKMSHTSQMRQSGFTLVELMIALVLGTLVVGAAGALFASTKRVYSSTETLNHLQENGRASFELMTRDIRETGSSPCMSRVAFDDPAGTPGQYPVWVNQLKNGYNSALWNAFQGGLTGTDNDGPGSSDSITLYNASGSNGEIRVTDHDTPSANIGVSSTSGIANGDILIVCNPAVAIVFTVTGISNGKIQHNGGGGSGNTSEGGVPAGSNCGQELQYHTPSRCAGASNPYGYCFAPGSTSSAQCVGKGTGPASVVRPTAVRWYLKDNGRGSRSLYRRTINMSGTTLPTATDGTETEIAEGVNNMQISYQLAPGSGFVVASGTLNWATVTAVRVDLTLQGVQGAQRGRAAQGTDGALLTRTVNSVVALRNREGVL